MNSRVKAMLLGFSCVLPVSLALFGGPATRQSIPPSRSTSPTTSSRPFALEIETFLTMGVEQRKFVLNLVDRRAPIKAIGLIDGKCPLPGGQSIRYDRAGFDFKEGNLIRVSVEPSAGNPARALRAANRELIKGAQKCRVKRAFIEAQGWTVALKGPGEDDIKIVPADPEDWDAYLLGKVERDFVVLLVRPLRPSAPWKFHILRCLSKYVEGRATSATASRPAKPAAPRAAMGSRLGLPLPFGVPIKQAVSALLARRADGWMLELDRYPVRFREGKDGTFQSHESYFVFVGQKLVTSSVLLRSPQCSEAHQKKLYSAFKKMGKWTEESLRGLGYANLNVALPRRRTRPSAELFVCLQRQADRGEKPHSELAIGCSAMTDRRGESETGRKR